MAKGYIEYKKFKEGEVLTRTEAMRAMCYLCNGMEDGGEDCNCEDSCPMYIYMPYNPMPKTKSREVSKEHAEKMQEGRKKVK